MTLVENPDHLARMEAMHKRCAREARATADVVTDPAVQAELRSRAADHDKLAAQYREQLGVAQKAQGG